MPFVYVYFYRVSDRFSNPKRSDEIMLLLSKALTKFYPLALRIVDNVYVDCNDEGVSYVEVVVKCKLVDVMYPV